MKKTNQPRLLYKFLVLYSLTVYLLFPFPQTNLHRTDTLDWNLISTWVNIPYFYKWVDSYYNPGLNQVNGYDSFSAIDHDAFSFLGGSFRWNQYYDNGFFVGDVSRPGDSLHGIAVRDTKTVLFPMEHILKSTTTLPNHRLFNIHATRSLDFLKSGSIGIFIHNNIGTEATAHPIERNLGVTNYRKSTPYNFHVYASSPFQTSKHHGQLSTTIDLGRRSFNSFDHFGSHKKIYFENYLATKITGDFTTTSEDRNNLFFRYSLLSRDKEFADIYYNEKETGTLFQHAFSLWKIKGSSANQTTIGGSLANKNFRPNDPNYSRNIVDADGKGFEPWTLAASTIEPQFNISSFRKGGSFLQNFDLKIETLNSATIVIHTASNAIHPVYYDDGKTKAGLYIAIYENDPYWNALSRNQFSLATEGMIHPRFLHYKIDAGFDLQTILIPQKIENSIIQIFPRLALELDLIKTSKSRLGGNWGVQSLPLTADIAQFLTPNHLAGTRYYWEDDGDLKYEVGERSDDIYMKTGGWVHSKADNLKTPWYWYMDYPAEIRPFKYFSASMRLSLKQFYNMFIVKQEGAAGDLINTKNENGTYSNDIFYYNGADTHYKLENTSSVVIDAKKYPDGSPLHTPKTNQLTFASALFSLNFGGERFYSSFSFQGAFTIGHTLLGAGYDSHTWQALSEISADKNGTDFYSAGRMSFDRGYTGQLMIGVKPTRGTALSFQLRYYDGEPFTKYDTWINQNGSKTRVAITKQTSPGDVNVLSEGWISPRPGLRNSAAWNTQLSFKAEIPSKKMRIDFILHNFLDIGYSLVEKTFSGGRTPLEIHNPPAAELVYTSIF